MSAIPIINSFFSAPKKKNGDSGFFFKLNIKVCTAFVISMHIILNILFTYPPSLRDFVDKS